MISLKRSRPQVARINLTPGSRAAASPGEEQERARERRHARIPILVLVALLGVVVGYFLFMTNSRRGALGPDDSLPIVAVGGRFAQRFADLLARSDVAGLVAEGPLLGLDDSGRWDPFKPLVELGPAIKPIEPDVVAAPPEPEPEPPSPPQVALTGVLRSGGQAIAILRVAGQTQLARVGESPFDGAVVRAIDDKSLVISFFGQDIHYSLGGEQQ